VLANAKDLVVVAGGDGTIRAVATRLLKRNIHIAPLPMGTADDEWHIVWSRDEEDREFLAHRRERSLFEFGREHAFTMGICDLFNFSTPSRAIGVVTYPKIPHMEIVLLFWVFIAGRLGEARFETSDLPLFLNYIPAPGVL